MYNCVASVDCYHPMIVQDMCDMSHLQIHLCIICPRRSKMRFTKEFKTWATELRNSRRTLPITGLDRLSSDKV